MARIASRLMLMLGLLITGFAGDATAEILRQEFKADVTRELNGQQTPPFHVSVEGRAVEGYVVYTITNLGEDWPSHAFAGLFSSRSNKKMDNARFKLKTGETYQLVVDFRGNPTVSMDFVLRPRWVPQEVLMRARLSTPAGWREAGAARHGRVLNEETASTGN